MNTIKILAAGALAAAGLAATSARASTTIDFESFTANAASFSQDGVTFTPDGPGILHADFGTTPNGTQGILAFDGVATFAPIRADIGGGASFVSVDIGDFDGDDDTLFLRAYDSLDNLIGSTSLFIDLNFTGMKTLSLSVAGIDHVVFGGVGIEGSSVYGDNFTWDGGTGGGVPEPASWALMLLGFGGLGAVLRSRRTALAA